MSVKARLWIFGGGGLARGVVDAAQLAGQTIAGLVVPNPAAISWFSGTVVTETDCAAGYQPGDSLIVAIGDNTRRCAVTNATLAAMPGLVRGSVQHPSAVVAGSARICAGSVILGGVSVGPMAAVGQDVLLYTGTVVEHDCTFHDGASTGPGAVLGGNVTVGAGSFIGLGARIGHGRTIGAETVIGMGAVVTRDVPGGVVAVGAPARVLRSRQPGERYL